MNELPSTSSGLKYGGHLDASTQKAIIHLSEHAEKQRIEELRQRRVERERYLREGIRQRERELELLQMHDDPPNGQIEPVPNAVRDLPNVLREGSHDSSESGYFSINGRRPKNKTEQMWDRMRARERRMRSSQDNEKKREDKRELDAMFHIMLHGSDECVVSDTSDYEFKFPAFMKFEEIKRGFDEQMKKENANRLKREEAERRAAAEDLATVTPGSSTYMGPMGGYNFPPIHTDWSVEKKIKKEDKQIKKEEKPQYMDVVITVYDSSDEEDNSPAAITKRAMKWANSSAINNCTVTSGAVITVHDSDSDSD